MKMNSISNKLLIIIVFVNETCDEDNDTVSIINHIDVQKYSNNSEYIFEEMISRETLVVFAESSRFVKGRSERNPFPSGYSFHLHDSSERSFVFIRSCEERC